MSRLSTQGTKWLRYIGIGGVALFGAATVPVVPEAQQYYVRTTDASESNFKEVSTSYRVADLKEASIVGEACYNEFYSPNEKTIRERIDCEQYWRVARIPNFPAPTMTGKQWRAYSTFLFDTPSGDLEPGYYAKANTQTVSLLRALTTKAFAAVAYDNSTASADVTSVTSVSFSHTNAASATLVVGSMLSDISAADRETNSCTYNSVNMFYVRAQDANSFRIELFVLHNPSSGSNTVTCTFGGAHNASTPSEGAVVAVSLTGADTHFPTDASAGTSGTGETASLTLTTLVDNSMVVDFNLTQETSASNIAAGGDLHTERHEIDIGGTANANVGTAGLVTPAGATTTSWTWTGSETWNIAGVSIRPSTCAAGIRCTELITTTGTSTWTAPSGVTSVDVACWGAGGGGENGAATGNGGGGGGAYASTTGISVTPGVGYDVHVAAGAAVETKGGNSQFFNGTTYSPIACGGSGATTNTGAAGGTTACSIGGAEESAGGAGGNGVDLNDTGGGGGGAGGPAGTGTTGANGGTAGGAGGQGNATSGGPGGLPSNGGGSSGGVGNNHTTGGGGGGGGDNGTAAGAGGIGGGGGGGELAGGAGGNGMCQISYISAAGGAAAPQDDTYFEIVE